MNVIQEYTTLKKAGSYWKGSCPFHSEKTGSFTVSPHKEIFYCFGCHAGGDLITFTATIENCSPMEAAQHLIDRYQLTIPDNIAKDDGVSLEKKNLYFKICELTASWCAENLTKNPTILNYLHNRNINQKSIAHFTIGFFPGGLAAIKMFTEFMKKQGILYDDLLQAHIICQGKTVAYSPFEQRIIFPIKDHLGRYCGFGGRIYQEQDQRAKYYNSRETDFFSKGSLLFGLDIAKQAIQKAETAFLVEGYTDCIVMAQYGYHNTVATLGTACTLEHLTILARHAQQLFILYDGDRAGQEAMLRLTELCWQVQIELKVICLPSGEDPASFLIKGEQLTPLIEHAKDIFEYFITILSKDYLHQTLHKKLQLAQKIITTIERLDNPLTKDLLFQRASDILKIPVSSLKNSTLASPQRTPRKLPDIPAEPEESEQPQDQRLEKALFFAIMGDITLLNDDNAVYLLEYLPSPFNKILARLREAQRICSSLNFIQFFDMLNPKEQQFISKLLMNQEQETSPEEFDQLLTKLQKKNWKLIVQNMKIKIAQEEEYANKEKIEKIIQDFLALKRKIVHKNLI